MRAKMGAGAKAAPDAPPAALRIIGGAHRGRKLEYSGDPRTRPMKDRVREAVFNLLGPDVAGKFVVDLFAGTGALGLEALSRGASRALFLEQHFPSAEVIRRNAATLGLADAAEVLAADTFIRFRRGVKLGPQAEATSWVVFCSPPFEFYVSRRDEMLELIGKLFAAAPAGSLFAVESDARFDFGVLPEAGEWDVREYPPARVGIFRKR
ncbi:MAG TPA: RsmD family RNA methyltransferase [Pirellulales bacterium]|nr:RsmD family RNA methyltransferase [Pirellulales bacterium]